MREILQFMKEHGAEQFLTAIGETDLVVSTAADHLRANSVDASFTRALGLAPANSIKTRPNSSDVPPKLCRLASFVEPTENGDSSKDVAPLQKQLGKYFLFLVFILQYTNDVSSCGCGE